MYILCNKNSVEDEIHFFLLECDFYSDLRYASTEESIVCNNMYLNKS